MLSDDDVSDMNKSSMASSELKLMFKSLMLDRQQEMIDQKREQKANALVIVNLKHQNQILQGQFEYLAKELEEHSRGDSSLSSIASMVSAARSLSFTGGQTPKHPSMASIGDQSETAMFMKESPTTTKLTRVVTETKNSPKHQEA